MKILIETMTRIETPRFAIRVWSQGELVPEDANELIASVRERVRKGWVSDKEVAEFILQRPRTNAVEVLDHAGNGPVLYKDWP